MPDHNDTLREDNDGDLGTFVSDVARRAQTLGRDLTEVARRLGPPRYRILLVGNGPEHSDTARRLAEAHRVTVTNTPESAYELACLNHFDLLLTDLELPSTHDGLWLCEQVRQHSPQVMRVLMAEATPADWEEHERSGLIHRFAVKPVHLVDLDDLLRRSEAPH